MRVGGVLALVITLAAAAPAAADTRAAIIDAAWDTRPFLPQLKAAGVEVIGRYLARCPQPERGIPQKRLIDQGSARERGSEVNAILDHGMAILSIYQFNNDSKNKFLGRDRNGRPLPDGECRPTDRARTPAEEAALDAHAAVAQAGVLGQPEGSAIYFGVDIAFTAADPVTREAMVTYFRTVRPILRRSGFSLGAYGNGDALEVLQREKLIDFAWLSNSRSYPGTSRFHSSGRWHLFQNAVNLQWFSGAPGACKPGLPLDTNVKNPAFARQSLGFWGRRGVVLLAPRRTRAVYGARRFICDGAAVLRPSARSGPADLLSAKNRCDGPRTAPQPDTVGYASAIRIGRRSGAMVEVDHDEDGSFDGWTAATNLTDGFARKPEWIFGTAERQRASCP